MLIRLGYDIQFDIPEPVPMVAMLHVHPSRTADLRAPMNQITPAGPTDMYRDSFGNSCSRFVAPAGQLRLYNSTLIEDSGEPDAVNPSARQSPVQDLPPEVLRFLLASRYCEVDQRRTLRAVFVSTAPGWPRVQSICDWVHANVTFGITLRVPPKPLRMRTGTAAACAATSSILRLRFADA